VPQRVGSDLPGKAGAPREFVQEVAGVVAPERPVAVQGEEKILRPRLRPRLKVHAQTVRRLRAEVTYPVLSAFTPAHLDRPLRKAHVLNPKPERLRDSQVAIRQERDERGVPLAFDRLLTHPEKPLHLHVLRHPRQGPRHPHFHAAHGVVGEKAALHAPTEKRAQTDEMLVHRHRPQPRLAQAGEVPLNHKRRGVLERLDAAVTLEPREVRLIHFDGPPGTVRDLSAQKKRCADITPPRYI
jgi:hypothetical protein